jgi:hypothetical protein
MTDLELAAAYVGMTPAELREALKRVSTCPLCIETGGSGPGGHNKTTCKNVLAIWADRWMDAKNSAF